MHESLLSPVRKSCTDKVSETTKEREKERERERERERVEVK